MSQIRCWLTKAGQYIFGIYLRKAGMLSAIFFALLLVVSACKKPLNNVGLEVQPEGTELGIVVTDTLSIISYIEIDDSVRTSNLSSGIGMLGSYNDPVFGITSAGIYVQPLLGNLNVDFTPQGGSISDVIIDSVVLSLVYEDIAFYYGDLDDQRIKVHRIDASEDFTNDADSVYYTFDELAHNSSENLTENEPYNWLPAPHDSLMIGGSMVKPQLRIRLDKSFGQEIVNLSQTGVLADNDPITGFLSYLKGLYITTSNGTQPVGRGGVFYFDLLDPDTKLTLYYHSNVIGDSGHGGMWPVGGPSEEYDFTISSESAMFSHVDHDYSGTVIESQLTDSTLGQQNVYVQAAGGVRTTVHFPSFMDLIDSGMVAINKAELYVPIAAGSDANYNPFDRIALQAIGDNGEGELIIDEFSSGDLNVDGNWNTVDDNYRFTLSRHMLGVLAGDKNNNGYHLLATAAGVSANRAQLNGSQNPDQQMKLVITYTKY